MRLREVVGRVLFASVLLSAGSSAARQEPGRDYVRLEYLEANGDVCVDTGVRAQRDVAVEARIACTPANSTKLNYMGAVYGSSTGWIAVGDYGEGKLVSYFAVSSRAGAGVEKPYDTAFHTYYAGNGCQAIDATTNDTVAAVEMGTGADNVPINVRLFGAANDWGETPASKNRVAFFNVYRQGEKILELVPVVRFENACLCFYDRVNDRYYEKSGADKVAGAGDFTPGLL